MGGFAVLREIIRRDLWGGMVFLFVYKLLAGVLAFDIRQLHEGSLNSYFYHHGSGRLFVFH